MHNSSIDDNQKMKSVFVVCLLALVCSTFAYKEASANKILNIVTTGKISELTTLCDSISDNKYQVNQIVAAVPQFENLLFDVLNELLVITPLIKDIVPVTVAPLVEKGELLAYKAINLVKKNLQVYEANAQRIINASGNLKQLQIRPEQIKAFFEIASEILAKINVPQC